MKQWLDITIRLSCKKSIGLLGNVSPGWWKSFCDSVVSCESMDSWFDQNKSELSISVGSEFLNMLSDINGLFDHMIKILWDCSSDTCTLENSKDLWTSDTLNLRNTVLISENDTDLRWGLTSLGHLDNLFGQIRCWNLHPRRWCFSVWKTSAGNTLSLWVHSTHCFYLIINNDFNTIILIKMKPIKKK